MNTLELKAQQYWQLSRAWTGQDDHLRIPVDYTLLQLNVIKLTSEGHPHLQMLCTRMMDQIIFQLNATEEQLEALP